MASANGPGPCRDARHVVRVNAVHIKAHDFMMHVCIGVADDGNEAELAGVLPCNRLELSRASITSMPTDSTWRRLRRWRRCLPRLAPASNFSGTGAQVASCSVTLSIVLAAGKEGRHGVEQFVSLHSTPMPKGPKSQCRKRQEVAADFGYVDLHVRHRLGTVDHEVAALLMHAATEFLDGVFDAQNVGHMHARKNLRLSTDFRVHFLGVIMPFSSG